MSRWLRGPILLLVVGLLSQGTTCATGSGPTPPSISITLNAIDEDLNDLLVVPPSGYVINLDFTAGTSAVAPATLDVQALQWGTELLTDLSGDLSADANGAVGIASAALPAGSYTLVASVEDVQGRVGVATYEFSVREYVTAMPPVGTGQIIWYDFTADRDGDLEPDFAADLRFFGLGSETDPHGLNPQIEADVIARLVSRVESAYYDQDPAGLGAPDPIDVTFVTADPGPGDVTQICIGGEYASYPSLIGSILIDRNNLAKSGSECGTIPPTGVFARGLQTYVGNVSFDNQLGPVMPTLSGTPAGDHPLDPTVLHPSFDPGTASTEEAQRYDELQTAIDAFANALGSIVAHETGHALGLTEPGPPGGGLHGGTSGYAFSHNVQVDGVSAPAEPWLMNAGNTLSFAQLSGDGFPLPTFRPLSHAYLRDRVVQDPDVTALLNPPIVASATPTFVVSTIENLVVLGENFAAPPVVRLQSINLDYTYNVVGESLISANEIHGLILDVQLPAGIYWVEVVNPDGQISAPLTAYIVKF